ncbi:DUF1302 domain-containing protein [Curvibacter sp. HBC61]|uniref:DUF1302 domain-containing protein n=1 Tax=Curvibacter cyanobacteriorum TaxID=3026422 RepID=A0ABT5MUM2_9BURK|nr:DUF1302 domain-containing protein [Curvibacter sp. HBC61]MDD0837754.1 DUF1302 domain-containing protein [Curvibacter sp. HBC61]
MTPRCLCAAARLLTPEDPRVLTLLMAACLATPSAHAIELDTGNPDWKLSWDNTLKYSLTHRLHAPSAGLSANAPVTVNQDDGNNNFGQGLASNRLDLLSELDLAGPRFGGRLSAAAWNDSVYLRGTGNNTFTANHQPRGEFTPAARELMGRHAEVLDAFVYARTDLAGRPLTMRLGRHTLLWGESLFFGANGIAGGQAPLDLIKLQSVPNATFKEIARPTGKLSAQWQWSTDVSLGGYLGYEWEKTRMMPVGAFLSTSDALGPGAERIMTSPSTAFAARPDLGARNTGQGGLQLRWRAPAIDTDFGLYAIRFHATSASNIYNTLSGFPPALTPSSYRWAYHEGIRAYGASFAKAVGDWSLAGEMSYRQNAPLSSSGQTVLPSIGLNTGLNNNSRPGYAVGETAHAQFSWLASLGPSFIANEASFVGEIAWNTRLKVTRNETMLNPNADKSAWAVRMVFAPSYRQVVPGLDLTPSIGVGYTDGRSSAVGPAFGPNRGGDLSLGLAGVYLGRWNVALTYQHFYGKEGTTLDINNNTQFLQALKDRDYLTLSLRTTF